MLGVRAFGAEPARQPLIVFGAASLTDTLQQVSDEYTKLAGVPVKLSFASSAQLAKQIESGALVDVFFPADEEWMDYLEERGFTDSASRIDILANRLTLIAPHDSKVAIRLVPNAPIAAALGPKGRLATGDPDSVPAGKYAKAALISLGAWESIEPRLVRAENVRVALSYVARGEAPLGIVYATDAALEPRVRVLDVFPESSHPPIRYPAALTRSAQESADEYLQFLSTDTATRIFRQAGFIIVGPQRVKAHAAARSQN